MIGVPAFRGLEMSRRPRVGMTFARLDTAMVAQRCRKEAVMTVQDIRGVGMCASLTQVGDWALAAALECARRHRVQLDIFFFPSSPFDAHPPRGRFGESAPLSHRESIELERRMRLYYDTRLGDYLDVGFRLCPGDEDPELRRCLLFRREFDILVLPYPERGCLFGSAPLEEFAESLPCPVILVGPTSEDEFRLNSAARPLAARLLPAGARWRRLAYPLEIDSANGVSDGAFGQRQGHPRS
jgi:hypothetical protein